MAYTRLFFGGRQPLCGIGVRSTIAVTSRPAACSERMAASRPAPGPRTNTLPWRIPCSMALRAAVSAARPAAYGVLLREPLKPAAPDEPQVSTLPSGSVMVTMVLLKLDWMYALPRGTFLRSRRRTRAAAAPRAVLRSATAYFFALAFLR